MKAFSRAILSRFEKGTQFLGEGLVGVGGLVLPVTVLGLIFGLVFDDRLLAEEEVRGE